MRLRWRLGRASSDEMRSAGTCLGVVLHLLEPSYMVGPVRLGLIRGLLG